MDRRQRNEAMWTEIALRIAGGEKQAAIARELGMKAGTFRYQLKRFLARMDKVESGLALLEPTEHEPALLGQARCEIASTVESAEMAVTKEPVSAASEQRSYPDTLFNESWTRKWSVSRLVLLVKEPAILNAYWEVDEPKRQLVEKHFQSQWMDLPFFLQLYDVTDIYFNGYNAHETIRIQVPPDADNWYVHGLQPRRRYLMDFGTTTWNGDFFTILRSNPAGTPPDRHYRNTQDEAQFAPLYRTSQSHLTSVQSQSPDLHSTNHQQSQSPLPQSTGVPQQSVGTMPQSATAPSAGETALLRPYPDEFDGYSVRTREGQ